MTANEIADRVCETLAYVYPNRKRVTSAEEAAVYVEALFTLFKTDTP